MGEEEDVSMMYCDDHKVNDEIEKTKRKEGIDEEEEEVKLIGFMDSLDNYLSLMDSLSSTLRQGWLELASARHSMGSSRISSTLFDLSEHSAHTTVNLNHHTQPHLILKKWGSSSTKEINFHGEKESNRNPQLRHRLTSHQQNHETPEKEASAGVLQSADEDQVQQKRSKSLSVFGGLVSPKLRAGQLSFEKALEIIVDLANMRSSMLSAFDQVRNEVVNTNSRD